MGTLKQDNDEKLLITLSDIVRLIRNSSRTILICMAGFALLGGLFALIRPVRYQAEATFREKAKKSGQITNSVMQLLTSENLSNQENEASQMLKSRKLLSDVIARLNLQGRLEPIRSIEGISSLIKSNIKLAFANFMNKSDPTLKDWHSPLRIDFLHYEGEVPLDYEVLLADNGEYEVSDKRGSDPHVGFGKLDEPFSHGKLMMVLSSPDAEIVGEPYFLRIEPMADTCKQLCKDFDIETTKEDKGVLKLTFNHRNRHLACNFINTAMECYQNYLQNYHNRISQLQLNYLYTRQNQLANNLQEIMNRHADFLSEDLFSSGFINSDKEMDFIAGNQHVYKEKLISNELEIKRLENLQANIYAHYDSFSPSQNDAQVINTVLNEIREYKQSRDGLQIEIQKKVDRKGIQESFDQQLKELNQVQGNIVELRDIIARIYQKLPPNEKSDLYNDNKFLIKGWFDRIEKQTDPREKQNILENFQFYLLNLERLFLVHEKILQERLTHQQNPSSEYQGINMKAADELYIDYSKQLIQMESTIRQSLFFINQMEDPNFEITSLSSVLTDPVSQDMIKKASSLLLTLRDQNNQSQREQERVKDELSLQRTFLILHLKQTVQLMELNKQLVDEKVLALQNVSLELIHRHISLLENTLRDYLESRLENLRQERMLINDHLKQIRDEMTNLPKKWVAEQMIEQEVEINQLIVEEIAKMVESKNIAQNLEMIQSAPLDASLPPVHPMAPKVLLFSILGMLLGGFIGTGMALKKSLSNGLSVSPDNVKMMGYHVIGTLSDRYDPASGAPINDADLDTMRRIQTFVDPPHMLIGSHCNLLLLVEGKGVDYSMDLAVLFQKKHKKVLRIYLNFDAVGEVCKDGLLQYLEGSSKLPAIHSGKEGDIIHSGGMTRFSTELLCSDAFKSLIESLESKYDWIIGVTHASPTGTECEALLPLFSSSIITLTDEKVRELNEFLVRADADQRRVAFLFDGKEA